MNAPDLTSPARVASLALLLVVATAGVATAQPTVSLRGNVGASFFRAPEATSAILNSGTSLGLEAEVRVYRGLGITVGGGYDSFTLNEENARIYARSGGDLAFLQGTVGLRYTYVNDRDAHPYLSVGAGRYQGRVTDRKEVSEDGQLVDADESTATSKEGIYLAAGSLFRLNETYAVFAEPRFTFYDLGRGGTGSLRYFTLRLGVDVQL